MNETIGESADLSKIFEDDSHTSNDTYIYDYQDSLDWLPLNEVIPCVTFYIIIGLFGISGNSLVIVVILAFPRTRNITNLFLLSLASADLLLVLICVPIKCATFFSYVWRMGEFLCIFTHYSQTVSMVGSVMTLTAMSVERYIVIVYPLRARSVCTVRHAKLVITVVWILAFVFSTPVLYMQDLTEVGRWRKAHWCVKWSRPPAHGVLFESYMFFILFVVPITIMIITYSRVSCEIWNGAAIRAELSGRKINETISLRLTKSSGDRRTLLRGRGGKQPTTSVRIIPDYGKTRKQVDVMLMVIVAFFIICWGPILFNNLLVALNVLDNLNTGYLKPMRMTFHLLSYLNSCVNPVVYGVMSHNFRDRLRRIVTRKMTRNQSLTATTAILSRTSTLRNHHQTEEHGSKERTTLTETVERNFVLS